MPRRATAAALAATASLSLVAVAGLPALAAGHPQKPATTTLTIRATKSPTRGDHYKAGLSGVLRAHSKRVAGETVALDERKNGVKKWTDTGMSAFTDSNGKVTFSITQTNANEQYRLVFAGDTSYQGSHSGAVSVRAAKQPKVLSAATSPVGPLTTGDPTGPPAAR